MLHMHLCMCFKFVSSWRKTVVSVWPKTNFESFFLFLAREKVAAWRELNKFWTKLYRISKVWINYRRFHTCLVCSCYGAKNTIVTCDEIHWQKRKEEKKKETRQRELENNSIWHLNYTDFSVFNLLCSCLICGADTTNKLNFPIVWLILSDLIWHCVAHCVQSATMSVRCASQSSRSNKLNKKNYRIWSVIVCAAQN